MRAITLIFLISLSTYANDKLKQITDFGQNPGNLTMYTYSPTKMKDNSPLVVLLHGCTQQASDFDDETGWIKLANERKFHLLLPETNAENNQKNCFNWFDTQDSTRSNGEALSIAEMIKWTIKNKKINDKRVYISGLSAGGAMTTVMISTYPELFSAAGIVAGVPYGCANNILSALLCMKGGTWLPNHKDLPDFNYSKTPEVWGKLVRTASNYKGTYPKVSIWQGNNDSVVKAINANELVKQWTNIHQLNEEHFIESKVETSIRKEYLNEYKETIVELNNIPNLEHGQSIKPGNTLSSCGKEAPYVLNGGICTSYHLANFFDL